MTVRVINHGSGKSISILTAFIRPMIKVDLDQLHHCFRQEVNWMLATCLQRSTLSALDLDHEQCLPHALLLEKDTFVCQKGINEFQTLTGGFKAVEIIMLCNIVPW
jgi:hypothetical protein